MGNMPVGQGPLLYTTLVVMSVNWGKMPCQIDIKIWASGESICYFVTDDGPGILSAASLAEGSPSYIFSVPLAQQNIQQNLLAIKIPTYINLMGSRVECLWRFLWEAAGTVRFFPCIYFEQKFFSFFANYDQTLWTKNSIDYFFLAYRDQQRDAFSCCSSGKGGSSQSIL